MSANFNKSRAEVFAHPKKIDSTGLRGVDTIQWLRYLNLSIRFLSIGIRTSSVHNKSDAQHLRTTDYIKPTSLEVF